MQTTYRCELSAPLMGYCVGIAPPPAAGSIDMSVTYGYSPRYEPKLRVLVIILRVVS